MTTVTLSRMIFVLLVFDVNDKSTFDKITDMIENFNYNNKNPHKLLIIVGNKTDKNER